MAYNIAYKHRAKTYDKRVSLLVLHYTGAAFQESLETLTTKKSVHYLIPDPSDKTYTENKVSIFNLVDEGDSALHVSESRWEHSSMLNNQSIGLALVNRSSYAHEMFTFPPYNDEQIEMVIEISKDILARYPSITATRVVGHSDIAFKHAYDPGPHFPWQRLYERGIGAWYDERTKKRYTIQYEKSGVTDVTFVQMQLRKYGYGVEVTNVLDEQTSSAIRAFQMHFRPGNFAGEIDVETVAILSALIEKYKSEPVNNNMGGSTLTDFKRKFFMINQL